MPINKNYFCVFDFETDAIPIETLNPIQLSALIIDPLTLDIVEDSEFNSGICPKEIEDPNYYDNHKSTIDFHCRNKKCSVDEFLNELKAFPSEKVVWDNFTQYLKKYSTGSGIWNSPIPVGMNIFRFDLLIVDKLCKKYGNVTKSGEQNILCYRDAVDIMKIFFLWWESHPDPPPSYSLDNVLPYLGMSTEGAHDSLVDVRNCAQVFIRFLKFFRAHSKKTKFRNSFSN